MTGRSSNPARQRALTIVGACLALILTGCGDARTADNNPDSAFDPVVYIDRGTGCQYLATGGVYALTPRLNGAGKHICVAVKS